MTGKKIGNNARDKKIASYVSESELEGVSKLGADYAYHGTAAAIRVGIALLIRTRHPELEKYLRPDLLTLDI